MITINGHVITKGCHIGAHNRDDKQEITIKLIIYHIFWTFERTCHLSEINLLVSHIFEKIK